MAEATKLTSKHQATIPKFVREKLSLKAGDTILFKEQNGVVTITKATKHDLEYLRSLESTLSEWLSPEDEEAFRDLQSI
jgi:AbrB family looped-hinge helix DNA binding protein